MLRVPFVGRLRLQEYVALIGSFILIGLEIVVRVITLALTAPIIGFFYQSSRRIFNTFSSPQGRRSRNKKKAISSPIAKAHDFVEICEVYGYHAEEHIVQTGDGYLLGVHRLGWRKGEEEQRVNSGEGSIQKKIVYLHHGLMMTSEVWVCLTEEERCLPFMLVEKGYDVWLGNNRGNKYSKKSVDHSPTSRAFWNFSMDQFAFHDIPDTIEYILQTTRQKSLSYIGFSQGTAQAFATLSIHPNLNEKVDVFIALAPAMAPPGLASGIVSSFVKASPEVLFLAFGRKAILSSATMWEALLYPALFVWFIDKSLSFLFGWKSKNMTAHQKMAAYPHLYSFTSTKSVVHWFQIIRNGTFQMYDDELQAPFSIANGAKYYKVAKFPTRNIKTPIVLVYGGSDSLVDIRVMLKELPKHTVATEIAHYEHLDFLWASDVHRLVFPPVLDALEFHASGSKSEKLGSFKAFRSPQLPSYSETERTSKLPKVLDDADSEQDADEDSDHFERRRVFRAGHSPHPSAQAKNATAAMLPPSSPINSQFTQLSSGSRPEGWWSSDEIAGTSDSPSPQTRGALGFGFGQGMSDNVANKRSSQLSIDSVRSSGSTSGRGITIGIGKAAPAEGLVNTEHVAQATRGSHHDEKAETKSPKRRGRRKQ